MDPDPVVVGNSFVMRYYTMLNGNPEMLHHFYHERSTMTYGHDDEPQGHSVHGIESIQKSIVEHDFKGCTVNLSVLDCQGSAHGGVFICAIGFITSPGDDYSRRKFVHTFFLERTVSGSDTSYYVLNDVFRYLDSYDGDDYGDDQEYEDQSATAHVHHTAETAAAPVYAPSHTATAPTAINSAAHVAAPSPASNPSTVPAPAKAADLPAKTEVSTAADQKPDRKSTEKKVDSSASSTWASRVGPAKDQKQSPAQHLRQDHHTEGRSQQTRDTPAIVVPNAARAPRATSSSGPIIRPGSPILQEGCSVFASNVPFDAKVDQLSEIFQRYNRVRNVVLKSAKGFAFIEFETPEATKAAWNLMQSDPPYINGRLLAVEERKQRGDQSPRGGFGRGRGGAGSFPRPRKDGTATSSPEYENRSYGFGSGKVDQSFNARRSGDRSNERADRHDKPERAGNSNNERPEKADAQNERGNSGRAAVAGRAGWDNKRTTSGFTQKS